MSRKRILLFQGGGGGGVGLGLGVGVRVRVRVRVKVRVRVRVRVILSSISYWLIHVLCVPSILGKTCSRLGLIYPKGYP